MQQKAVHLHQVQTTEGMENPKHSQYQCTVICTMLPSYHISMYCKSIWSESLCILSYSTVIPMPQYGKTADGSILLPLHLIGWCQVVLTQNNIPCYLTTLSHSVCWLLMCSHGSH